MLVALLLFITTIILLYLSSRSLISHLIKLFLKLTKSQDTTANLLFFLLLPGVFLHEFSHTLSAEILQVPTGHLSLKPHLEHGRLRLGSAQIARTDPIRLTLIGTAPFLTGTLTLWALLRLGLNLHITNFKFQSLSILSQHPPLLLLAIGYLLFAVSNTMFSSPSDLQAAGLPIILLLILLGVFNLTNLTLPLAIPQLTTNLFLLLSTLFFLILILNLILLLPLKLLKK